MSENDVHPSEYFVFPYLVRHLQKTVEDNANTIEALEQRVEELRGLLAKSDAQLIKCCVDGHADEDRFYAIRRKWRRCAECGEDVCEGCDNRPMGGE